MLQMLSSIKEAFLDYIVLLVKASLNPQTNYASGLQIIFYCDPQ